MSGRKTSIRNLAGTSETITIDVFPDRCGICDKNIDPKHIVSRYIKENKGKQNAEIVFQCTNIDCNTLIIGYYVIQENGIYHLNKIAPITPIKKYFNPEIEDVSSNFIEIYNQSFYAEQNQLTMISGIGYRKALEFLIKDYLIYLNKESVDSIVKKPLGQCIDLLVNPNISEIAKRATWIGNDEAHYTRKWEDKDVDDLKKLIEITVYFIAMDVATKKYLKEMS